MTAGSAVLDHVVVNALFETDAAAACFSMLGFTLTPRGYHSLGSVNHLMMFSDHYLELVGLPVGATVVRKEILESRLGLDGLVYKTDDAQATYACLLGAGVRASEPQAFTRPLEIDGRKETARFRTTRLLAGEVPGGRIYFCEHLTPQWVFRPEWATHPNGASGLFELVIVGRDPSADAGRYALAVGICVPGFTLSFLGEADYAARYGELSCKRADRDSYFGSLTVVVKDLRDVRTRLEAETGRLCEVDYADSIHPATGDASIVVFLRDLNVVIEFIGAVHDV
ncbi:VOC family protein [Caballeronia sp. DA-9]|uniref:VOC family protein n=1 Tax=Caballeronia sp. DA-9 TaxID=3436237 RepID=UPI003F662E96